MSNNSNNICASAHGQLASGACLTSGTNSITVNSTQPIYINNPLNPNYNTGTGVVTYGYPYTIQSGGFDYTAPAVWGDPNSYYNKPDYNPNWVFQNIDKSVLNSYLKDKNYSMISIVADNVLKTDRRLFNKFEKVIKHSNDFDAIAGFIKQVNSIDISYLTSTLISSYEASDNKLKESVFIALMIDSVNKLNLKKIIDYACKHNKIEFLEWMIAYGFGGADKPGALKTILNTHKIKFSKIEKLFYNSSKATAIFGFAKLYGQNTRAAYNGLRRLGEKDLARKLIDETNEEWANALKAMK